MSGIQTVNAPVGSMSKIAPEPWPSCQNRTMKPHTAPIEMMLNTTALSGSSSERNTRASRTYVISAITITTHTKLP